MSSLEKPIYLDFFSFYKGVIKFLLAFALKNNKNKNNINSNNNNKMADNNNNNNNDKKKAKRNLLLDFSDSEVEDGADSAIEELEDERGVDPLLCGEFSADLRDLAFGDLVLDGDDGDGDDHDDGLGDPLYGGLLLPTAAASTPASASSSATLLDFGLPPTPKTPPRVETLGADDAGMEVDAPTLAPVAVSAPTPQPPASADGGAAANVDPNNNGVIVVLNPVRIICKLYFVYSLLKFVFNQIRACLIWIDLI